MGSKRHQRRKACDGKIQYKTSKEAMTAAHGSARRYNQRLGSYKCQFGSKVKPHFHVGHTPARIRRLMELR